MFNASLKPIAFVEPEHVCTKQLMEMAEEAAREYNVPVTTVATYEKGKPQVLVLNLANRERVDEEGRRFMDGYPFLVHLLDPKKLEGIKEIYIEQRGESLDFLSYYFRIIFLNLKDENQVDESTEEKNSQERRESSRIEFEEKKPRKFFTSEMRELRFPGRPAKEAK